MNKKLIIVLSVVILGLVSYIVALKIQNKQELSKVTQIMQQQTKQDVVTSPQLTTNNPQPKENLKETIEPYKISAIKAYLYNENDKSFSENIIDNPNISLLNVFLSGAKSTKVVIEVQGKPDSYDESRHLQFTSTNKKDRKPGYVTNINKTIKIGKISKDGRNTFEFWVPDTGAAVELEAKILGQDNSSKVNKTINFIVGE